MLCLLLLHFLVAVLLGRVESQEDASPRQALVEISGPLGVIGYASITQKNSNSPVNIEGQIFNLPTGAYEIKIHENGDVSALCSNVGGHFNPTGQQHGSLTDTERHAGDLGTIQSEDGVVRSAKFKITTPSLSLYETSSRSIVHRSLVVSKTMSTVIFKIPVKEVHVACGLISSPKVPLEQKMESLYRKLTSLGLGLDVGAMAKTFAQRIRNISKQSLPIPESSDPSASKNPRVIGSLPIPRLENLYLLSLTHLRKYLEHPEEVIPEILRGPVHWMLENYNRTFTKCFKELGCVVTDRSWYDLYYRNINLEPQDPSVIETAFILHTRARCYQPNILNPFDEVSIRDSGFNAAIPTKFIVHGFLNSGRDPWVRRLADALLTAGDFNVIAVDWRRGALQSYAQATANTRVVGLQIAHLIKRLMAITNVRPEDVHIIGHSLGAQIAGYAGQNVTGLGRITGLDPAGPYFQSMPEHVRLDPADATFVEALHTNAEVLYQLGYGTSQLVGHIDFFPNGGKYQPGCELLSLPFIPFTTEYWNSGTIFACNHNRAVDLYIDAIAYPMTGYKCQSYEDFLRVRCNPCSYNTPSCAAPFGLQSADPAKFRDAFYVPMYFETSSFTPYRVFHYRVTITSEPSVRGVVKGNLNITVTGETTTMLNPAPVHEFLLEHGTSQTFLFTSPVALGSITDVYLKWDKPTCLIQLGCGSAVNVNRITIGQMTAEDPDAKRAVTLKPCSVSPQASREIPIPGREAPCGMYCSVSPGQVGRFSAAQCTI